MRFIALSEQQKQWHDRQQILLMKLMVMMGGLEEGEQHPMHRSGRRQRTFGWGSQRKNNLNSWFGWSIVNLYLNPL